MLPTKTEGFDLLCPGWVNIPLRTPTLPPATTTNAAILGSKRFVVIDPGSPYKDQQDILHSAIASRLDTGSTLTAVVFTHHHGDHIGGFQALETFLTSRSVPVCIAAHPNTLQHIRTAESTTRKPLHEGDTLDTTSTTVHVLHTPGHASGHIVLHDREQAIAHVGDMVAGEGTIIIQPPDGDMSLYLQNLRRLQTLSLNTLIPSHGSPIERPHALLEHFIQHRLKRETLVLNTLTETPTPISQLLPAAYPDTPRSLYPLAAQSLRAHLLKLQDDQKAINPKEDLWSLQPK